MVFKDMKQITILDQDNDTKNQPVTCLGMTFANDEARRAHFIDELRKKLPELKQMEGFPIGEDEVILALSDPPYYTACPNPFILDFIKHWEEEKKKLYGEDQEEYHREPFATDVSEGKNDPIYNAHSYHTKVPHKAIMRYILHYTEPGDVVFDGFCGTGMTGVAAQLCGSRGEIEGLGYRISPDSLVIDSDNKKISKFGERLTIISDLSPLATFIAYNYTDRSIFVNFADEALAIIELIEQELSWLYQSNHGELVLSAIWSDVFLCPNCNQEFVFWDTAVRNGKIQKSFPCPYCGSTVGKCISKLTGAMKLDRSFETIFDPVLRKVVKVPKFVMVEETIQIGSHRKARRLNDNERGVFKTLFEGRNWPKIPTDEFFPGRQTNKLINGTGISHLCHMYTPRALFALGQLWQQQLSSPRHTALFRFCLSAINNYVSRKQGYFGGGGGVSGTLFTPSLHLERNVFNVLRRKIHKLRSLVVKNPRNTFTSTQSIVDLRNIPNESVDYIFTDPPFGESLQYAELNMFVEAWLGVKTVVKEDCVLNYVHGKDLSFYSIMMASAFKNYARILKPGRWITIEFHNSQNAVWSAIQQAIESSGLVVADVRVLDKQQRSFNAVNRAGAVDQDLVISAYKPNGGLEDRFRLSAGAEDGVWDFVRNHLKQLPVFVSKEGKAEMIAERQNFLLFDRMVAFHVQRGLTVPLSAAEFYAGLAQRFPERDGMYFLSDQVAEYDKKRLTVQEILQLQLFVTDESSAIKWLKQQLTRKPQTFQELHPLFFKEISGWQKYEKPLELSELLEQNFLRYDGIGEVPSQIHSYLSTNFKDLRNLAKDDETLRSRGKDRWYIPDSNKAVDLEKLREKFLLREFTSYMEEIKKNKKKLKQFRTEAIRTGFKKAWGDKDYQTIVDIGQRLPESILQEDDKLLMYYDNAQIRLGI